jgi:hypothetical protein
LLFAALILSKLIINLDIVIDEQNVEYLLLRDNKKSIFFMRNWDFANETR